MCFDICIVCKVVLNFNLDVDNYKKTPHVIYGGVISKYWCRREESNLQPIDYETIALPLSHVGNYIYNNSTFLLENNVESAK